MESTNHLSVLSQALQAHPRLSTELGDLRVDALLDAHLPDLFKLVTDTAQAKKRQERPFAADEYPTLELFQLYAASGYMMVFTDTSTDGVVGYGFITPSYMHRAEHPLYSELRVLLIKTSPPEKVMIDLFGWLMKLAGTIGYRACIIDTFSTDLLTISAAHALGFQTRSFIPLSGTVPGQGLTDCFVMFKSLSDGPLPEPDDPSIKHLPKRIYRPMKRRTAPPFLPVTSYLQDDTPVQVTQFEEKHIDDFLRFYRQAIDLGQGFGESDMPSVELLLEVARGEDSGDCFVIEMDGAAVAFLYLSPSLYCRSYDCVVSDICAVVDQRFGGKGIGTFLARILMWLCTKLGFKGALTDTFVFHTPITKIVRSSGFRLVGTTSSGGYLKDKGWSDLVLVFKEAHNAEPFHPKISNM